MINQETIQRIMDATRIEDVVGDFVQLKKRGANYIACCPFHNEKTPSFNVNPARGIFKCFGCGKGGDSVRFLMDLEHFEYPEALRWLAKRYNIAVEEEEMTESERARKDERDALYHLSEFAQQYFADNLFNNEMGSAIGLSYFHQRGMSDEIIRRFGLGFCLDEWDNFTNHARANGYSDDVLGKTGLTVFKDDGKSYDRFRGRVMFPIYTISGRVQGFSGRILTSDKSKAKYVNSPESDIYLKKNSLYGIYQAKSAIVRQDKCYLVEGNIDVVSMHQSGVENTVASCGTSLTEQQARMIGRFSKNVTVVYDGDRAGIKATLRAVDILLEEGLHVRMVLFPDGDDPDSYAQKHGSTALQEYLRDHEENFVLYKTRVLMDDVQRDPIKKSQVLTEIVQTIAMVPDRLERVEYVRLCSSLMQMNEATLQSELAKAIAARGRKAEEKGAAKPQMVPPPLEPLDPFVPGVGSTVVDAQGNPHPIEGGSITPPTTGTDYGQRPAVDPRNVVVERVERGMFPDDVQENKVISLMVNHADTEILYNTIDENGEPHEEKFYVSAVVASELMADEVRFDNPVYQQIFDLYVEKLSKGELLDVQLLIAHPDAEVRETVATMMMNTLQISPEWEKKDIFVPKPEEHVAEDVIYSVRMLKLRKLERKIKENGNKLKTTQDADQMADLLREKCQLVQIRQKLCAELNCIIK